MNLVVVGHKDHGKSTLIGRILYDTNSLPKEKIDEIKQRCKALGRKLEFAYICDALEEERKKEMTIDATQVCFRSRKRKYTIIDTPGHIEFLRNMITGATQAEAAILIVDVKDGIKEQTKRHVYLLKLLGIRQVIIAVNKMDLVEYRKVFFDRVKEDVQNYLDEIGLKANKIIPISAYYGENVVRSSKRMKWFNDVPLIKALDSLNEKRKDYCFRFCIQDVYTAQEKKIYVGNVISGEVKKGDKVKISPGDLEAKVVEIVDGNKKINVAKRPHAIGIVLHPELSMGRGFVMYKGCKPKITKSIETVIFSLEKITSNKDYLFCCSTQEILCKVRVKKKINPISLKIEASSELKRNEIGEVELKLKKEAIVENFENVPELGRFVLKEHGKIVAGGTIRSLS